MTMTFVKRSGILLLTLMLTMTLLAGCSDSVDVKQNSDGSYGGSETAATQGTEPTAGTEGPKTQQKTSNDAKANSKPVDTTALGKMEVVDLLLPSGEKIGFDGDSRFDFYSNKSVEDLAAFYQVQIKAIGADGSDIVREKQYKFEGTYKGYKGHVSEDASRKLTIELKENLYQNVHPGKWEVKIDY